MIFVSDIHLNLKPVDSYRWDLFPMLSDLIDEDTQNSTEAGLYILGDLTQDKDRHSNELINKIAENIIKLSEKTHVTIITGNHDYSTPAQPVLAFLDNYPSITYYTKPTTVYNTLYLPHSFEPEKEWNDLHLSGIDYILAHQTVQGSLGDNGKKLKGIDLSFFQERGFNGTIISGDVHTPQTCIDGELKVIYLGSPYHINFGCTFEPRLLMVDSLSNFYTDEYEEIVGDFPHKITLKIESVEDVNRYNLHKGDLCKVKYTLSDSDKVYWREYKQQVKEVLEEKECKLVDFDVIVDYSEVEDHNNDVETVANDPSQVYDRYVKQELTNDFVAEVGKEFL